MIQRSCRVEGYRGSCHRGVGVKGVPYLEGVPIDETILYSIGIDHLRHSNKLLLSSYSIQIILKQCEIFSINFSIFFSSLHTYIFTYYLEDS